MITVKRNDQALYFRNAWATATRSEDGARVDLDQIMLPMALCADARLDNGALIGDPTEGALIVLAKTANLEGLINTGVTLDAKISEPLIESIFNKEIEALVVASKISIFNGSRQSRLPYRKCC